MSEGTNELELKFEPQTIKHLGLQMYSTLPPALAELISNAYDADASEVVINLIDNNRNKKIEIIDNGSGLLYEEINTKFLRIGRDRRAEEGDNPSPKFHRKPTGKKGLGKLALFGLAKTIIIQTIKDGFLNEFKLDWDKLIDSSGSYKPEKIIVNQVIEKDAGTTIILEKLKRVSAFDFEGLADSLSKIFIFDNNFSVIIKTEKGDKIILDNKRKYKSIQIEFKWEIKSEPYIPVNSFYEGKVNGELISAIKPLSPQSKLRGITLFSRGKLVNMPEFFSNSDSSHFFQYLTGWLNVDFIDDLEEDVISTNRQSLDWENPEMKKLREFLAGIISQINQEWRKKRKEKKQQELAKKTSEGAGINTEDWLSTMPSDIRQTTKNILEIMSDEDTTPEVFVPVVKLIHTLVPEYPTYHWRHLHGTVQEKSRQYYEHQDYYNAFIESMKKYISAVREKSGINDGAESDLMGKVFSPDKHILSIIGNYKKINGNAFAQSTIKTLQNGQMQLSQGIVAGARNPLQHIEIEELHKTDLFSESDCLDFLSLLSHLFKRLDNSKKVQIP